MFGLILLFKASSVTILDKGPFGGLPPKHYMADDRDYVSDSEETSGPFPKPTKRVLHIRQFLGSFILLNGVTREPLTQSYCYGMLSCYEDLIFVQCNSPPWISRASNLSSHASVFNRHCGSGVPRR